MEKRKNFGDLSIAIKLNAVQSAALVVLFAVTIGILSSWLSTTLEQRSLEEVQKTNRMVVDMIDVYGASLEQSAEKLGATLASFFPQQFTLDEGAMGTGSMPLLKHGGAVVNLDFTTVDRFTSITGAVATVFARQADDFVRVSTSLRKEDGERAVRTFLGKAHPGFARLMRGEAFTGKAKLFGRDYMTRYLPVVDKSGKTVAVLFIGVDFTDGLKALKKKILGIKIGETGYVFAIDAGQNKGELMIHPAQEGQNILDEKDSSGREIIKEMIAQRTGVIHYDWINGSLGEKAPREKVAAYASYDKWNWIIGSGSYKDEFLRQVTSVRYQLIAAAGIIIPLILVIVYFSTRRWVALPLGRTVDLLKQIAAGDLTVRVAVQTRDEAGQLLEATRTMAHALDASQRREKARQRELAELNQGLEREVKNRTEDLSRKAAELEDANRRLLEVDRMKSNFLSSVSHELRTPLTSILGFAKLIDKDFSRLFLPLVSGDEKLARRAERVGSNLNIIVREGERLTRLINDVLDLAKIESGRVEWRDSVVEIKDLVEQSVQAVSGQFAGLQNVVLKMNVAAGLPRVTVDRDRLTQVLINLLNNAAKFTKAGIVEVSAAPSERGEVKVSVRDTGSGIPPEFLDKVFEKFQQVTSDTLSDKPQGTGLGLPICRQIVQHYGGRIWVESELGHGSTFIFTLPAAEAQPLPAATPAASKQARTKPLILVVDDDASVRGLLVQLLEDDGYDVITAADGKAALDLAQTHQPDLITMDLMMPGMDGYAAIEHLRNDQVLGHTPIVVITALGENVKVASDATLRKPVNDTLFLESIRSMLSKEAGGAQPCLVLEPPDEDIDLPTMRLGSVERVSEQALWQRLDGGFRGTVVIGHGALKGQALDRLAGYGDIQVVIVQHTGATPKPAAVAPMQRSQGE